MPSDSSSSHPLLSLPREDLDLVARLVLHSGSLKDLAAAYGVSYPTIRLRLDRVIGRLQAAMDGRPPDPLTDLLANLVERGEITPSGARAVRDLARSLKSARPASDPDAEARVSSSAQPRSFPQGDLA